MSHQPPETHSCTVLAVYY